MPIAGQTALTTIHAAKELEVGYQPLLLVDIGPFDDGAMLYLSTENLDSTDGGFSYDGRDYKPRIKNQDPGSIQAISDNGIVQSPSVSLMLADADNFLWSTYEYPDDRGFKGTKIVFRFVFWDAGTETFSSDGEELDTRIIFSGICNPPARDAGTLTLTAGNLLNMTRTFLPAVRIQRRCPWVFPTRKSDRKLACYDEDSEFYECGYSPDITVGDQYDDPENLDVHPDARGNFETESTPFTDCGGTWDECIARMGDSGLATRANDATPLQIEQDTQERRTGRFGGIHFDPPDGWRGRSFATGDQDEGINNPNDGKYNDFFPMVLGQSFVEPPVMNVLGEANSTRFECVIGVGQIHDDIATPGPVEAVIVNDFLIPHISQSTGHDGLLAWSWVNHGGRDGYCNRNALYDGAGDPYGSLATIMVVVHRKMHDSTGVPKVRVLTRGPKLREWDDTGDPTAFTRAWSMNPAWITAEILTWAPWTAETLKLQTFNAEAAYCLPDVTYTNYSGEEAVHDRYQCGITLRERRSVADILRVVLAGYKALLRPNKTDGKLELLIKKTLADQQPAPIAGSNYDEPVISANAAEEEADGYVAYHFNESNILRVDGVPSLRIEQRPITDTPNRLACAFQDQDYFFTNDTLVKIDLEDVGRAKQEVAGSVAVEGVVNWDQAARAIETTFAENFRANPRSGANGKNDTGGSWMFEWVSTARAVHLSVGDIVGLTFPKYGLETMQLLRVMALQPSANYETVRIRALWHEDDWYLDRYGQRPDPLLQQQRRNRLLRPPFGWSPNQIAPHDDDVMFPPTRKTFALTQFYEAAADGTSITKVRAWGKLPVNSFSKKISPPYAPTATYGGSGDFPEGTCYFAMTAQDADGAWTAPSWPLAKKEMPGATGATVPNIYWQSGTAAWKLYAGYNPNKLSLVASGSGTPASVSASDFKLSDEGMPDVQFDRLRFKVKRVFHSGVFGVAINEVSGSTLTCTDAGWTVDEWAGRDASVLGQYETISEGGMGVWDFRVVSNTADTLTVTGDPEALGVEVGDALIMRTEPDVISASTIGDTKFNNSIDYYDPPVNIYAMSGADEEIAVVTTNPHFLETGDLVELWGVEGNTAANTQATVTVWSPSGFNMDGVIGNGSWEGGGFVSQVTTGLREDEEAGRLVRIIAGKGEGQVKRIVGNSDTTLTIEGTWDVTPDSTSRFIVEEDAWLTQVETTPTENADPTREVIADILTENFLEQTVLVKAFTVSADNRESIDSHSPEREIYLFGGPGTLQPQFDKATFIIYDTTETANATNLLPVRRGGTLLDATITCKAETTGDFEFDIFLKPIAGGPRASILTTKLFVPSGTAAGEIIRVTDFVTTPFEVFEDDVLDGDVLTGGDDVGVFTVVLKWETRRDA